MTDHAAAERDERFRNLIGQSYPGLVQAVELWGEIKDHRFTRRYGHPEFAYRKACDLRSRTIDLVRQYEEAGIDAGALRNEESPGFWSFIEEAQRLACCVGELKEHGFIWDLEDGGLPIGRGTDESMPRRLLEGEWKGAGFIVIGGPYPDREAGHDSFISKMPHVTHGQTIRQATVEAIWNQLGNPPPHRRPTRELVASYCPTVFPELQDVRARNDEAKDTTLRSALKNADYPT